MIGFLGGLLVGVLKFYAWTVGLGLVVLGVIALVEGTFDLVHRHQPAYARRPVPRHNA